jgi:hypothetical protein
MEQAPGLRTPVERPFPSLKHLWPPKRITRRVAALGITIRVTRDSRTVVYSETEPKLFRFATSRKTCHQFVTKPRPF